MLFHSEKRLFIFMPEKDLKELMIKEKKINLAIRKSQSGESKAVPFDYLNKGYSK